MKDSKNLHGGKRNNAGRPAGGKNAATIDKELMREALRAVLVPEMASMTAAQVAAAKGVSHFILRDPKTGKFERVTDPERIVLALNADGAEEGSTFYIHTKDPSTQAYTDLMNRLLDKPAEQVKHTGEDGGPVEHVFRWQK